MTHHIFRNNAGGKAVIDVTSDVQPAAVRTVTATVVSIVPGRALKAGPVQGNAVKVPAIGDVLVLTEQPATRPRVPLWAVTISNPG